MSTPTTEHKRWCASIGEADLPCNCGAMTPSPQATASMTAEEAARKLANLIINSLDAHELTATGDAPEWVVAEIANVIRALSTDQHNGDEG